MRTERQKLYSLMERQGVTSLMNNTRWREVFGSLNSLNLLYRVKLLRSDTPCGWGILIYGHIPLNYVEPLGCGGPVRLSEIEWLEIDTQEKHRRGQLVEDEKVDHCVQVLEVLSALNISHAREESVIRIYGHFRQAD